MVVIVDYGVGNLGSISNMLKRINIDAKISSNARDIQTSEKLILPGVGSFDYGMNCLRSRGLAEVMNDRVLKDGVPILGICLGMQLFAEKSEEGSVDGLGWIPGTVVKFNIDKSSNLKVPHMGWADVLAVSPCRLFSDNVPTPRFYFVHSFHYSCANPVCIKGVAVHSYEFPAVIEMENIVGVQFHPEKSHKYGMSVLKNFCEKF
jgi:glutamine amidotransferase